MDDLLPELCDQFPDLVQVVEPMFGNFGGRERFGGEIVTLKAFEDNSLVREQVALPGEGRVLVVDSGGSMRRAMLGDMLAEKAVLNGWSGIIIYGCIRDVNAIGELDLGVQALGANPMKTDKKGIGELNVDLTFGGVTFKPGHYVYADNNGILVSPEKLELSES
ncbi:ribonuclease E activity regulator RraA [uncultured Amphritea sp.]|uniref:ribonuclease E activity regulator RraA n=1 Tax=uncultured Amphritea sp. TaxID=981605 RepID=UPI001D3E444F|nr:ribonuclease E activity regulator RraA [uncultured Amphritea sp.]MBR9866484.1 putative 4-hydroxy-4-methyl-2-oxoglutarate aldolase [Oceanospirillales bacterium]MBR9887766.1 putative 4-hydroxy-4-methyl-2-oxoglutarate aldolase [Oceanospirillales bacterium]